METIWNKEELKKISNFLRKMNYKFDNNNIITLSTNNNINNDIEDIKKLFYLQDKEAIKKILNSTYKIKELVEKNPNNPLYFGLISFLSKINSDDYTQIFNIYKEILSQYAKVSSNLISILTKDLDEINYISTLQFKIKELKESSNETEEEIYIKNYMEKILAYTTEITNNEIFKEIIEKCNNNIKARLIHDLNQRIICFSQRIEVKKNSSIKAYQYDKYYKIYSKKRRSEKDGYNLDRS